jgi:hypothetical protein
MELAMETLWEKILNWLMFWKKQKTYKEGVDYTFHQYGNEITAIELLREPYNQVLYHYGGVNFSEHGEVGVLNFNYSIIHSGCYEKEDLQNDQNFCTMIGDILSVLIIEQKAEDEKIGRNDTQGVDIQ